MKAILGILGVSLVAGLGYLLIQGISNKEPSSASSKSTLMPGGGVTSSNPAGQFASSPSLQSNSSKIFPPVSTAQHSGTSMATSRETIVSEFSSPAVNSAGKNRTNDSPSGTSSVSQAESNRAEVPRFPAPSAVGQSSFIMAPATNEVSSQSSASPAPAAGEDTAPVGTPKQSRTREMSIPVPFGAKVPAAVVDVTPDYTAPQQAALEAIIQDFEKEVAGAGNGGLDEAQVWEAARMRADNRYRILFGDAAYNMMSMQAAIEALEEKKGARQ